MNASALAAFLHGSGPDGDEWSWNSVVQAASKHVDDVALGPLATMLRGDVNLLWARWFVFSMCDPNRYLGDERGYAHVYEDVRTAVGQCHIDGTPAEVRELHSIVAGIVHKEVVRLRRAGRGRINQATRDILWDIAGPEPRCWICGASFPEWARARFLRESTEGAPGPPKLLFVDYLTGRGLAPQDLQIEVDHVVPASLGGNESIDNLKLSCGWCNRAKREHSVLYDAGIKVRVFSHPKLGNVSCPHPFWVVRALAVRGNCQFAACDASAKTAALVVAPQILSGRPTPSNIRIFCTVHDPIPNERQVSRLILEQSRSNPKDRWRPASNY